MSKKSDRKFGKKTFAFLICLGIFGVYLTAVLYFQDGKWDVESLTAPGDEPRHHHFEQWTEIFDPISIVPLLSPGHSSSFFAAPTIKDETIAKGLVQLSGDFQHIGREIPFAAVHDFRGKSPDEIDFSSVPFLIKALCLARHGGVEGTSFEKAGPWNVQDVRRDWYDLSATPVDESGFISGHPLQKWLKSFGVIPYWPAIGVLFDHEDESTFQFVEASLWHEPTRNRLSHQQTNDSFRKSKTSSLLTMEYSSWMPLETTLVVDYFHGKPIDLKLVAPFDSSRISSNTSPGIEAKVLLKHDGWQMRGNGSSVHRDAHPTIKDFFSAELQMEKAPGKSSALIAVYPATSDSLASVIATNSEGKVVEASFSTVRDRFLVLNLSCPLAEVSDLQFSFRPAFYRAILPLPVPNGLPEENRNVTDWLDQKIPYFRATPGRLLWVGARTAGFQCYSNGELSPGLLKVDAEQWEVRDTTPRELLVQSQEIHSPLNVFEFERENSAVKVYVPRREEKFWDRAKGWLRNLLP